MFSRECTQKSAAAFTLIELLASTVIVSILAALLLTVVSDSLGTARKSKCVTVLRNVYLVAAVYADDNEQHWPTFETLVRNYGSQPQCPGLKSGMRKATSEEGYEWGFFIKGLKRAENSTLAIWMVKDEIPWHDRRRYWQNNQWSGRYNNLLESGAIQWQYMGW